MSDARSRQLAGYEPALDGLRAFAVIAVVIYHVSRSALPGGWFGVDVFFVLSGFLITTLLHRELERSGGIDLKNFYMRRILRLTPAFWLVLAVVSAVAFQASANLHDDMLAVLISGIHLMNWSRAFDLFPQGQLGHTWSLAMEEQFYLVWPVAFLFIARRQPLRWIGATIVLVTLWRVWLALHGADPERTYNGFDTHADALLIGCGLALLPLSAQAASRARQWIAVPIVLALMLLAVAGHRSLFTQTAGLTFASLVSAWLILGAVQEGWFRRLLSVRPLVYTGRISYGWYLWHYPFLTIGGKLAMFQNPAGKLALVVAAYGVAMLSFRFVEKPILKLKVHFEPKRAVAAEPIDIARASPASA